MILDQIKTVLDTLAADVTCPMSGGVYYGICNAQSLPKWNHFVFNRARLTSTNNNSYTYLYEIHIVHENYIPEDYELTVIHALKEAIPGFSLADDITYDYYQKGDTQVIVEICNMTFKKVRKVNDGR